MDATIVERPAFTVVGLLDDSGQEQRNLAGLWQQFCARWSEITGSDGSGAYGVITMPEPGKFSYIAGMAVAPEAPVPDGMVKYTVPAARYAIYTYRGKADGIKQAWDTAFQQFLAEGYTLGQHCLEYYPPDYSDSDDSVTELWFEIPAES